jgi:hypothetical protein
VPAGHCTGAVNILHVKGVLLIVYVLNTASVTFVKFPHPLITIPGHKAQDATGLIIVVDIGFHPIKPEGARKNLPVLEVVAVDGLEPTIPAREGHA